MDSRWPRRTHLDAGMAGGRLTDSGAFAYLWRTDEVRALFEDRAMYQTWLEIFAALALAHAGLSFMPPGAAADIDRLNLDLVASETRGTSHSTLSFITAVRHMMPADAAEYVYYGATVQDLTDTWAVRVLRDMAEVDWRDLHALEGTLMGLARAHRETVMAERTRGQPGAPITVCLKVASWADEVRRPVERLAEGRDRWLVGQLGSAVGTLGFFGDDGTRLRTAFSQRRDLADPMIAWLTARDRFADFALGFAMVCSTLARIGGEIYEISRPEINQLREAALFGTVGSITMPHKRNPERAEHFDTLARLARANAGVVLEGKVQLHERDGRRWKAEWAALPEVRLDVDAETMTTNIKDRGGYLSSEEILAARRAQAHPQNLFAVAQHFGRSLLDAVAASNLLDTAVARRIVAHPSVATATRAVDAVIARAATARAAETKR